MAAMNIAKLPELLRPYRLVMSKLEKGGLTSPSTKTRSLHRSELGDRIESVGQAQRITAGQGIPAAFEERLAGCLAIEKPARELEGHLARQQLEHRNFRADRTRDITVADQLANERRQSGLNAAVLQPLRKTSRWVASFTPRKPAALIKTG